MAGELIKRGARRKPRRSKWRRCEIEPSCQPTPTSAARSLAGVERQPHWSAPTSAVIYCNVTRTVTLNSSILCDTTERLYRVDARALRERKVSFGRFISGTPKAVVWRLRESVGLVLPQRNENDFCRNRLRKSPWKETRSAQNC